MLDNYYQYRKIVELITKELTNTASSEEHNHFLYWLEEKPENELLFEKIKSRQNYVKWRETYENIDTEKNWDTLCLNIKKERRKYLLRNFYRYAATFTILIVTTIAVFYFFKPNLIDSEEIVYNNPGSAKAVLILNDGKSIELDSLGSKSMLESDGTEINKEGDFISYSNTVDKKEKLLYNTIKIPRGGEYKLQLSDGTKVYLNSLTTLSYPVQFDSKIREVEITGEAYFEVTKMNGVPFIVNTPQSKIEVLGTSFNVNAYGKTGKVITTLVEGRVKVQPGVGVLKGHILEPSEQSVFNSGSGALERNKVNVELYVAWTKGEFIFYNERLEDIMEVLTRWYEADILFENSNVKELKFSGKFNRYEDIQQILEIIEATEKIEIDINKNTILFR